MSAISCCTFSVIYPLVRDRDRNGDGNILQNIKRDNSNVLYIEGCAIYKFCIISFCPNVSILNNFIFDMIFPFKIR